MNQYTKLDTLITFPCVSSAPIKMEIEPVINQVEDSVNITWLPPSNNSGINETILYDIQCFTCTKSVCNKSCTDLVYNPSRYNLTQTSVRVSGLVGGETYQFRIFPKNSLNIVIPRCKWEFIASKPFTFQSRGRSFIIQLFLRILFLYIINYIKYNDQKFRTF